MSTRTKQSAAVPALTAQTPASARQSASRPMPGTSRTSATSRTSTTTRSELPPYKSPSFPLNPNAQRALGQLSHIHSLRKLDASLSEAAAGLTNAAGDINERLAEKERNAKKRKTGPLNSAEEAGEDVQRKLEQLREQVEQMTQNMDEGIRKVIDSQHSLQFIKAALQTAANDAHRNATTQASTLPTPTPRNRTSGPGTEPDEDDEIADFEPTDPTEGTQLPTPPLEVFRAHIQDADRIYRSHSMKERYADNNDYRGFKTMVHQMRYPDEDVVMQHQDEWFGDDGNAPPPGVTATNDDSDDDIAISRRTISTKCPLTLREFQNPLSSTKCPHSFESSAILELIQGNRARNSRHGGHSANNGVQCPVTGCSEELTRADLREDPVLLRRIKAIQRARQLEEEEEEAEANLPHNMGLSQRSAHLLDDEDDDADVSADDVTLVPATQMKTEQTPSGRRRTPTP